MPEKFPEPVYHPEPIKIPESALKKPEAKDKIDKALDIMEDIENKIMGESALKLQKMREGIRKGAEALTENPIKKIFRGVWEGLKNKFKKPEEFEKAEFEKIEMPRGATMETEAESMIDLSKPEITKKEPEKEYVKREKKGLTPREKEMVALSRLSQKKK